MSVPYVIESGPKDQERVYDLYSRLLKDRVIFVKGDFCPEMADGIVAQLLFLEATDPAADIFLYIHSPGGSVESALAIFDTMNYIRNPITTIGYGQVASAGTFILGAGTEGKRFALKNCEIMIHELSTGNRPSKFNDLKNDFKHTEELYEKMALQYSEMTKQPLEKIKSDMTRDYWMSADAAKEYGLIDEVLTKRSI